MREAGKEPFYNFGDPYYLESGYGLGYMDDGYSGDWYGSDQNWGSPPGMEPGANLGPGGGPGIGWDYAPGMDPGMGVGQGDYGYFQPGPPGGNMWCGNQMDELLNLMRETNENCREVLELIRAHHQNGNCGMSQD